MRRLSSLHGSIFLAAFALLQFNTTLSPKATVAFDEHRKRVESQLTHRPHYPQLQAGAVRVDPGRDDGAIPVDSGIVHDWIGATFVPNTTVEQILAVLQNYPSYKTIYAPDVVDSRLLSRNGNQFRVYLKIIKSNVLTEIVNSEYEVEYLDLGNRRWAVNSRSTRIAEIQKDQELPPGTGHGFVWHLNAYWLLEPQGNGVYIECRTISLSRDVPRGLGFAVKPFIRSFPVDSLRSTLEATVKAVAK